MERDFLDTKNNMFSKFNPFSQHFPVPISSRDSLHHDSTPSAAATSSGEKPKPDGTNPSDGASIEVVRRPRGRPPGSKNKPKPPVVITREASEPTMSPYILEVQGGNDIVEAVSRFCRRKSIGLSVLAGSGNEPLTYLYLVGFAKSMFWMFFFMERFRVCLFLSIC